MTRSIGRGRLCARGQIRAGGTRPFGELLEAAGIPSPFEAGSLSALGAECVRIADELEKKL